MRRQAPRTTSSKFYILPPSNQLRLFTCVSCYRATGYSCFATSHLKDLVAVAEYGLKPKCNIYQFPGKKLFCSFEMNTTLKSQGMAFSRDAKYLVLVGGLPDFKISIFDLEKKQLLIMPETKVKTKESVLSVSFNPKTKDEFCILTASFIHFYKILPAFEVIEADDEGEGGFTHQLIDAFRMECREFSVANIQLPPDHEGTVHMTSLKWDCFGRVLLCTNLPFLYQINPNCKVVDETGGAELEIRVE
jgi:hypothetical protein